MHGRRSLVPNLEPIDLELEKTLRTHKHVKNKIDLQQQTQPQERPFKDYFSPLANLSISCIRYLNVSAWSFELKLSVLNCLPTFYDLENEDPYNHLNDFHAICQILNMRIFQTMMLNLDYSYFL